MKIILKLKAGSRLQKVAMGLTFGAVLVMAVASAPAHAEDWRDHRRPVVVDRDWHAHEGHAYRYWHHPHYRPEPRVVYAPPVIYAPPQYEEPGFNLVVPLHIH